MTPQRSATQVLSSEDLEFLDRAQLNQFAELGYLILPGILPYDLVARLKPEVDRWVDDGLRTRSIASSTDPDTYGLPPVLELEMDAHGELTAYAPLMAVLSQLIGRKFVFHHLHSDRQAPLLPGKAWHHDYEQDPQSDRKYSMIHTLHYLDGLEPETAALVVLPRSHRDVAEKLAYEHLGTDELPGEVVIDDLPPGSTVVLHSALFHARRRTSAGPGKSRYMVDTSYCQTGTRWPPVKPYWRYMLRRGRELGLGRGGWPELFAERHFSEYVKPGPSSANK
ncbi:MAG TPA: phytanoyl-CoA dioxygenase [Micromonosporaceae bacterium]|nr:phytanoyl-CoA dioxygenase [Micromonosporaceae bacterium]HCU48556.1 phytanoyl-CoA dioxygenase [Micromonosporaceae bacterium]